MIEDPKSNIKIVDVDGDKLKSEMQRLSSWTVNFGKYKTQKFKDLASDRDYSMWIIKQEDFINKNIALKKFLAYTLTHPNN